MYARAIEDAAKQLRELRIGEGYGLALGGAVLALSILATQIQPALAIPLFLGGLYALGYSVRAALKRSELLDRLALERDAYAIPEVLGHASRAARMTNRNELAASIRRIVESPGQLSLRDRVARCEAELEALAGDLEREDLELDPGLAFACQQLLTDGEGPLYNPNVEADELLVQLHNIRSGFSARRAERMPAPWTRAGRTKGVDRRFERGRS
jgi:hypothetical protein